MKKILVCQHVAYEPLGTLNPLFKGHGIRIRYVNFGRDPQLKVRLEGYQGLVVLGGPMCVGEMHLYPHLAHEIEMIEQALRNDIPVLGICLGAQLLAKALGAEVRRNSRKEIGWHDLGLTPEGKMDPLLGQFSERERIIQWHSDTFDIPAGAVHLATSPLCPNQAFRYGDKAYGFQFHLEADTALVERWLTVPKHLKELEELKGKIDADQIRRENQEHMGRQMELSRLTFGEFIRLLGVEKTRRLLPSR